MGRKAKPAAVAYPNLYRGPTVVHWTEMLGRKGLARWTGPKRKDPRCLLQLKSRAGDTLERRPYSEGWEPPASWLVAPPETTARRGIEPACPGCGSEPPHDIRPVVNRRLPTKDPERYCRHPWHGAGK